MKKLLILLSLFCLGGFHDEAQSQSLEQVYSDCRIQVNLPSWYGIETTNILHAKGYRHTWHKTEADFRLQGDTVEVSRRPCHMQFLCKETERKNIHLSLRSRNNEIIHNDQIDVTTDFYIGLSAKPHTDYKKELQVAFQDLPSCQEARQRTNEGAVVATADASSIRLAPKMPHRKLHENDDSEASR